ncbi:DEAD/DEAH box helicase [Croceibacterium aestuarii]|uniref:DEAD/DEAH box helicase n=1 Tax=Croceibacterium aestuarii TaxID=3064139 RepID=UPI00272EC96C|nr:DEAD/DEAH box helicase family protein [Croceibacterium sp. D39]
MRLLAEERRNEVETLQFIASAPEAMQAKLMEGQVDPCIAAWKKAQEQEIAASPDPWRELLDGYGTQVPHVCLNLPTGSGKTLIAGHAVGRILGGLDSAMTGFVLWVMPSEAIYKQTRAQLRDRGSPVRQALEVASGGRVKLVEKANDFTAADVETGLVVMTLMLQSSVRKNNREVLKVFRDSGNYVSFYPDMDDKLAMDALLAKVPNLETNDLGDGTPASVKQSLGNTLRIVRPLIVLDEGHNAYSETARKTLGEMNPRFLLELTATPDREQSNILVKIGGQRLRAAEMLKLPIELVSDANAPWKDTLKAALDKRAALERQAREHHDRTDQFIRPILLVRVERTGKDQRDGMHIHTEDVREELLSHPGVQEDWIKVQTASVKELDDTLMDETSQVRVIITKDALREGWDCPWAYVLALLSKTQAKTALTQMIGRVLRQPGAQRTGVDDLDSCWVYCSDIEVKDAVESVRKGLDEEGMGDLKGAVRAGGNVETEIRRAERRAAFKGERILVPAVTHSDGKGGWRQLDFDGDILGGIDWEAVRYTGGRTLDLASAGAARARTSFDYGQGGTLEKQGSVERTLLANDVDRPDLARRLLGLIPNPWVGIRLVDEGLGDLRARGIADEEIARGRLDLLADMRTKLTADIDERAREIFEAKLDEGLIAFKLTGAANDWEMDPWVEVEFAPGIDTWMRNADDENLQLSLFDQGIKSSELNGFEREVALYLDGSDALAWWWRLASRGAWGLQGWRRHRVYPDFLMKLSGDGKRLFVLETKGKQLDNSDTAFKRDLMQTLQDAYEKPSMGEVELFDDSPDEVRFRMLLQEENWRSELGTAFVAK